MPKTSTSSCNESVRFLGSRGEILVARVGVLGFEVKRYLAIKLNVMLTSSYQHPLIDLGLQGRVQDHCNYNLLHHAWFCDE